MSRYKTGTTNSCRPNREKMSKLILVLGATGAQGRAVVNSLLAPSEDGSPSPYAVRAFSRDPESKQALSLREQGVQVLRGRSTMYGRAWVRSSRDWIQVIQAI